MSKKIYIACDHGAVEAKTALVDHLKNDYEVIDLGTNSEESVHYPEYGHKLAEAVLADEACGIALCGSGIGISIAVNRHKGIRGALCRTDWDAEMSRKHNDSNIICFGGRVNSTEEILKMTDHWLATEFEGGRHQDRIEMIEK